METKRRQKETKRRQIDDGHGRDKEEIIRKTTQEKELATA